MTKVWAAGGRCDRMRGIAVVVVFMQWTRPQPFLAKVNKPLLSLQQLLPHGCEFQSKSQTKIKNAHEVERSTSIAPVCSSCGFNFFHSPLLASFTHSDPMHLGHWHVFFSIPFLGWNAQSHS
jgi:hypothetical protein